MERRGRRLAAALGGHMHWERQFVCLCVCLHVHAPSCMALTTTCTLAHMLQTPDGNSLSSWCNWTVFDCNTKDYKSCLQTCTCKTPSREGKAGESLSHTAETFLLLPMNTENARCRCKARARMHGLNEKRCESEWCPPFWILISSSDISTPHLPSLFHINQPCLISSIPTSVLSLSSICIRNRIWGTMLSYHRSEWERMSKEERRRKSTLGMPREGGTEQKWDGEDGDFVHFVFFIHLLFRTVELLKLHGPNWTNDWA